MTEDMQGLVARITGEVLKRIKLQEEKAYGTLAVFTGYVFDDEGIAEYIKKNDKEVSCVLLDGVRFDCGLRTETVASQQEKDSLAGRLKGYENILISDPPLWLINAIARGDDSVYAAMLALRPLLWGRDVTVLLDFEAPKNRRSPAFLRIAEDISAIEEMGIKIAHIKNDSGKGGEPKELVTEQDVKDAVKNGKCKVIIKPGAIVTQLAQDTAKELGVLIEI
jgi:hypothetical protein